jgi:hypothetical protein
MLAVWINRRLVDVAASALESSAIDLDASLPVMGFLTKPSKNIYLRDNL